MASRDRAAGMAYGGGGQEDAFVACKLHTVAEIDILTIAKEPFVKPIIFLEDVAADYRAGAAGREAVALTGKEGDRKAEAAAPRHAEDEIGIAHPVEIVRPGEVKLGTGEMPDRGMAVHARKDLLEPVRLCDGVRVQEGQPFTIGLGSCQIVTGGKAEIGFLFHQPEGGQAICAQAVGRAVAGIVVEQDDFEIAKALARKGIQGALDEMSPIIIYDDDAEFGRLGSLGHLWCFIIADGVC